MESRDVLYKLHYESRLSTEKIGKIYEVSGRCIRYWFKKLNIEPLGDILKIGIPGPENKIKSEKEKERLRTMNIGREPYNKGIGDKTYRCKVCSVEFSDKPYRKKVYCSKECRCKSRGDQHFNYKGLENRGNQTKRSYKDYIEFKKLVHIRDKNTCALCFDKGVVVHHILSWKDHEDLRFDVSNGLLLCKVCHRSVHKKFGQRNYDGVGFREFLLSLRK